ncbi:hypothetical protein [Streptomyces collinus]|uniref:hypothetical protein n=1 Tax=Streptomyces collinus TaxID=42684 RepID=UPI0033EFE19F
MSRDEPDRQRVELLCPSAAAHSESVLIGVVTGSADAPRVRPTDRAMPVTQEVLDLAQPVSPTEVAVDFAALGTALQKFGPSLALNGDAHGVPFFNLSVPSQS